LPNNILLVDDDEMILETYKAILEHEGHIIHTASNPYKAIQIINNHDIQLAILDYNLPSMTGTQLGHLIKKAQKFTEVMFISGNSEIHEIVKTVSYDVRKVFSKPIDLELLIQTINSTLGETESTVEGKFIEKQIPNMVSRLIDNIIQTLPITSIQTVF
jgi:DNA-binding NtrC family response regulator